MLLSLYFFVQPLFTQQIKPKLSAFEAAVVNDLIIVKIATADHGERDLSHASLRDRFYLVLMTEKELFLHFPMLEKALIHELLGVADVKTLAAGEVLLRTGQHIRSTLLVLEGLIKIYREDEEGNEFFMYYLDAGKACAISLV